MRRKGDADVYIRRDTKKGKGRGKKGTTYLSIAHNVREEAGDGTRAKPVVFANLGYLLAVSVLHGTASPPLACAGEREPSSGIASFSSPGAVAGGRRRVAA